MSLIEPRVLKGFRDFLPQQEAARKHILALLEKTVTKFGFSPIDTPVLEYAEVLLGKGGGETDKQVFAFEDNGGRKVAMRFDLTVPFARFMAANSSKLPLPFKRYHFAKVYRGENPQRGRYREFVQCDFDCVGVDSASSDFEILLLMHQAFLNMGIDAFKIHIAHRGLFNRFLKNQGLSASNVEVLRAVDKLGKVGEDEVRKLLVAHSNEAAAEAILAFIGARGTTNFETLDLLEKLAGGPDSDSGRLRTLLTWAEELGIGARFHLDPSITRGLDYYTGVVYETFLDALPGIGSVCSGGRYNNLAALYTKEDLPGVGSSIGLDRLIAALDELGMLDELRLTARPGAELLILCLDESLLPRYHKTAQKLREQGISCEVYPGAKKLAAQFSYAEKAGISWALIAGADEVSRGVFQLKNLSARESRDNLELSQVIASLRP